MYFRVSSALVIFAFTYHHHVAVLAKDLVVYLFEKFMYARTIEDPFSGDWVFVPVSDCLGVEKFLIFGIQVRGIDSKTIDSLLQPTFYGTVVDSFACDGVLPVQVRLLGGVEM